MKGLANTRMHSWLVLCSHGSFEMVCNCDRAYLFKFSTDLWMRRHKEQDTAWPIRLFLPGGQIIFTIIIGPLFP